MMRQADNHMQKQLYKYWRVWKTIATNELQTTFINRGTNVLFFLGKSVRLAFMLSFLLMLKKTVKQIGGYTSDQIVVFFLVYQFIDTFVQIIYRGVYLFSNLVRSGEFDFMLLRPIRPLFGALTGKPDINDTLFLIPSTALSVWIIWELNLSITLHAAMLFGILLINSLLIATALHILVLVIGIMTTEVDGVIWFYRDCSRMAQFPVSLYMEPLRSFLYFVVPVGVMITIPAETLLGSSSTMVAILACTFGCGFFILSLQLWKWSLTRYQSASS